MELWELEAREAIRDTIARYAHAGDRLQIEALAECFAPDGVLAIRGRPDAVGRAGIVAMLTTAAPNAQPADPTIRFYTRHNVSSIRIDLVSRDSARAESYFFVVTPIGPDHWGRYRDHLVHDGDRWLFRRREVSVDDYAPGSTFGRG